MTMPPQRVKVECPRCKTVYEDWFHPSINMALEPLTPEQVEEMATVCCPNCGRKMWLASVIVNDSGQWLIFGRRKSIATAKNRRKMKGKRVRIEFL